MRGTAIAMWSNRTRRSSCSGVREAGVHRGWPETGARRSFRPSTSARGEVRPERLGAPLGHRPAQHCRPLALAPELGAPRPEPARDELELVLVGEADRAVDLVRD